MLKYSRKTVKVHQQTDEILKFQATRNELASNLRVADHSISVIKLNPPYDLMVDLEKVPSGRGERT